MHRSLQSGLRSLVDELLEEQQKLTAADRFSHWHESACAAPGERYRALLPSTPLKEGQQYAFEVNLDACSGCKACVSACHSLNGLADEESWRSAGLMVSENWREPRRQTITTACHHCEDPACANGCPTLAYEKDGITGIVAHLDDQCMGCGYCAMTCPYEVPQMEPSRGIVRKCDMCRQRLDAGEAPACVQACPSQAIRIIAVERGSAPVSPRLLPSAPPSWITRPTTQYISTQPILLSSLVPENAVQISPGHGHWPLVVMLVFTQWGAGAAGAACFLATENQASVLVCAIIALHIGLGASVLHLGRPLQAWRAWLGWRKSWLSREVIGFGLFAAAVTAAGALPHLGLVLPLLPQAAALIGIFAVITSGMVYHVTRRQVWAASRSVGRFLGTAAVLGAATTAVITTVPVAVGIAVFCATAKLAAELRWARCDNPGLADETQEGTDGPSPWMQARHHRLLTSSLGLSWRLRLTLGVIGVVLLGLALPGPVLRWLALAMLVSGELLERLLFFQSAVSWRMPGWRTPTTAK